MNRDPSSTRHRLVVAILMSASTAALSLLACAESSDSAFAGADSSVALPPAGDAGPDTSDESVDADAPLPEVPCAVGNVCRVQTPLTNGTISAISGRSRSDVWAAGSLGLMMRWDGLAWTVLGSSEEEGAHLKTLSSLSLDSTETWAVAGTTLLRRGLDPESVRSLELYDTARALTCVITLADGSTYVGSVRGGMSTNPADRGLLIDVTSFDPSDIWVMPAPRVAETGQQWPMNIRAMAHAPGVALWTVGDHGAIARFPIEVRDAGERWTLADGIVLPIAVEHDLFAAWADGDHLWAAGNGGVIVHIDGTGWQVQYSGTGNPLRAIFGFSATDVWAAGDGGVLLHFDGTEWSRVPIQGYSGSLRALWGGAPDDLWIGGEGAMFHWGALP